MIAFLGARLVASDGAHCEGLFGGNNNPQHPNHCLFDGFESVHGLNFEQRQDRNPDVWLHIE